VDVAIQILRRRFRGRQQLVEVAHGHSP
jgi:hypothetical protein